MTNILVVDDQPYIGELLSEELGAAGAKVVVNYAGHKDGAEKVVRHIKEGEYFKRWLPKISSEDTRWGKWEDKYPESEIFE